MLELIRTSWDQHRETLSEIRREVFIEEQGVNEDEEWDALDAQQDTQHFLAYWQQHPVACARTVIETIDQQSQLRISRLAVRKPYRGQQIAVKLMRHMMQYALQIKQMNIHLHAQQQALGFYLKLGFKPRGETFTDAGIEHQTLFFDMSDGLSGSQSEYIYHNQALRLTTIDDYKQHMAQLLDTCTRRVDIFSHALATDTFAQTTFINALTSLIKRQTKVDIRILVQESRSLTMRHHPLLALAKRLPSRINIMLATELADKPETGYLIVDQKRMVFFNDERQLQGFVKYCGAAQATHQLQEFNYLWNRHSQICPDFKRLSL